MNDDFKYLSDEELNSLIESTEQSGLLEAPISFEAEVLKRLEKNNKVEIVSFEEKKKEYSRFKFQVCMAMAAAILFLVVAPFITASEGFTAMKEQAEARKTTTRETTSYVSEMLGNHLISETIGR
ncbi:hypothetical protein [Butyrivibrio sp. AC2005]|uniref:hypothetical protein n=1 Tax=Butyrivibrio sp. AC2005 TaxID=1280672 RepID=UPI00041482EB|nr:hypothetical protein [Butyrivibrio sp. AC2005]